MAPAFFVPACKIMATAIVPVIQGYAADVVGLLPSFWISALCYVYIIYFGLIGHRAGRT